MKKNKAIPIMIFYLVSSIILVYLCIFMDILPNVYLYILMGVIAILFLVPFYFIVIRRKKSLQRRKAAIFFKFISLFLAILYLFATLYLYETYTAIDKIVVNEGEKLITISVVVPVDEEETKFKRFDDKTYALRDIIDIENTDYAVSKIKEITDSENETIKYIDFDGMVDALYSGEADAMILNESYRNLIVEHFPDFESKTKVLYEVQRAIPIERDPSADYNVSEPFSVYISGNDYFGELADSGRSDVNIIMTINPKAHKILLTTTPRDYYVGLYGDNYKMDKLTHAGVYGIDCSIETLENLYGIDINYYMNVNFSSVIEIIDALGGVDVEVEHSFYVPKEDKNFTKGTMHMDGETALVFARDRKHQPNGDKDRGKNQQRVLSAVINKLVSPAIIMNYTDLLDVAASNMQTNMSTDEITQLIKNQIIEMDSWEIEFQSVDGFGASRSTYSMGSRELYVMIPDEETLELAKDKINSVISPDDNIEVNPEVKPEI